MVMSDSRKETEWIKKVHSLKLKLGEMEIGSNIHYRPGDAVKKLFTGKCPTEKKNLLMHTASQITLLYLL